jgi:hypothetical protein
MAVPRFPFRGSREAPTFDGTPITVNRYFQDIDQLFDNLGIANPADASRIQKATYYLDPLTADLWESILTIGGATTWNEFKDAIRALYPGSDRSRLYSVRDLDNTVLHFATNGVYTRADLGEYCREFRRISNYLRSQNRIDDGACNRLFIQGFGDATRRRIESRLLFTLPDHHPDDPYPEDVVRAAAHFLLSATSITANPITAAAATPALSTTPSPPNVVVKQEPASYDTLLARIEALSILVNQRQSGTPSYPSSTNANAAFPNRCHFCGKPGCRIATCPEVETQIKDGTVARSADGKVTLPSGAYLPRTVGGRNLAEKFARFHADNPGHKIVPGIQAVKMYETVETMVHIEVAEEESDEEADEDIEDLARVFAAEASRRFEKGKRKTTNSNKKDAEPAKPALITPPPKPKESVPKTDTVAKPEVAFHFASPCDNPALITQVWNKALDATITVTPRELLAVSTDMRKRYREFTTTKRVPGPPRSGDSALFDMLLSQITTDGEGQYVADDSAPLRTMRARVGDRFEYDCVVDNGSSIVAINKEIWAQLGAPARSDLIMRMESSHGTVEKTIGVLKNYPITIGTEEFLIQVQVSENLPCEVLLGRPFFMLASATTIDHPDGSQEITLINPNTNRQITVATQERNKKKRSKEDF